jgi:hypothetical protein
LHPLESAAFSRRTPKADIGQTVQCRVYELTPYATLAVWLRTST